MARRRSPGGTPILFDTGTYGYSATVNAAVYPFTPWLMCPSATVPAAASTALDPLRHHPGVAG